MGSQFSSGVRAGDCQFKQVCLQNFSIDMKVDISIILSPSISIIIIIIIYSYCQVHDTGTVFRRICMVYATVTLLLQRSGSGVELRTLD